MGASGTPGEDLIVKAKSGYYINETFSNASNLNALADELKKLGHHRLSQMVEDGTWLDEDKWLCYSINWYHRPRKTMPWDGDNDGRDW